MDADPVDPITDYAQTQRVVLLIDLNPLLHLLNPNPYINSILAFAKTLLSFPPLSSSLFSFKLFFSSLSPLLSSSKLHRFIPNPSLSLSFNDPTSTLQSLCQTLNSLPQFHNPLDPPPPLPLPRASHLAASMRQLVHDYAWDPVISDPLPDTLLHCNSVVRSNLVVLCSPISRSVKSLSEFFDVETDDESLENLGSCCEKISRFFRGVSEAFDSRDIHLSWVDFCESEYSVHKIENDEDELRQIYRFFESGTKTLGWGLCKVDSIILGSALVPFGLIYPKIGISWSFLDRNYHSRKLQVQLSLQILDVSRNPIEYNCCDLELIDLKFLGKHEDVRFNPELMSSQTGGCDKKEIFWKQFGHGIVKFQIRKVYRLDAFVKLRDCVSDSILVREGFGESKKNKKESTNEFFADRVLEILATEFGHLWQRKSVPIWQILLNFLYKEGCWALVSLSNGNGVSLMGVLRPFTVSSALLSVVGNSDMACDYGEANMAQLIRKMDAEICKPNSNFEKLNKFLGSQAKKSASVIEGHQKKEMVDLSTIQNITWSTFCNAAYEHLGIDLYEVYSAKKCNESKKMKFLKCWMKQMKRPSFSDLPSLEKSKPNQVVREENNNRLIESLQAGENPISSSGSAGENGMTEASRMQDDAALEFRSETSDAFFSTLSIKIHQGIESEVVDIGTLAERLVNSSIYWLYQKFDKEAISENHSPSKCHDAYRTLVAAELIKLLLREPKELAAKHKSTNPGPTTLTTEHIVREYELQILFRMEILQSEVGSGVEESSKQKFVRQICLLLENIQCHMEGGFFGDWNLDNYVAKIIKSRFSNALGDMVQKIYNKMDLLLFADEEEAPNQLLNSEDSNKSWMEKADKEEMDEKNISNGPVSAENEPHQLLKNDAGRTQRNKQEDHDKKITEAKERRERARRFVSFTSWMPDLQRVWAPKQKAMKLPKRKERRRASYDRVCETPMTGHKRSCPWENNTEDDTDEANGSQIRGSVSKALFQDEH